MIKCIEEPCDQPATFVRCTQFAGDHEYCDAHAHAQDDFQKEDSADTFFWTTVEKHEEWKKKHA